MFFRGLFKFFLKFVSFKNVVRYLDLFYFNWLININQNLKNTELLDKFIVLFCTNINSKNYTIFNKNTLSVIYFRKKNLPMIEEWFKKSVYNYYYNVPHNHSFLVNFYFFIEENPSFQPLRNWYKSKDDVLNTYIFIRDLQPINHYFNKQFYTTNEEENLVKIYYIFYKFCVLHRKLITIKTPHFLEFYNLRNYKSWFKFTKSIFGLNSNNILFEDTKKWYFERWKEISNPESIKDSTEKYTKKSSNWFSPEYDTEDCYDSLNNSVKITWNDWKPIVSVYSLACQKFFNKNTFKLVSTIFNVRVDLNNLWCVFLNNDFLKKFNNFFPIRYSDSSINKFINISKIDNFVVYHLRKIKIFNKGRYSRNRQTYRTGFYWCLWLNIFVVYGLQFVFYRYTFTYGYLWIFLFIFIGTFIFSRALKYNLVTWNYIWAEKKEFFKFFKFIFVNFYVVLKKLIEILFAYLLPLLNGSEYKKVIWNESDFDVDTYNFFEKQWFYDIRNWFNDYLNDYFNDDVISMVVSEIDFFENKEKKHEKNILEFEKTQNIFWLTIIHEWTAEIYQNIVIEFEEFKKRLFEKFLKL